MNILAVDFGTKNIGLAWCDAAMGVVLPFGQVGNRTTDYGLRQLADLIKKEKIDKIVVGLPVGLDGKENANTERVKKFVDDLKTVIDAPIEFFDERFTSQAADRMGGGVSRDEKSAMVILEGYLEKIKKINDKR